MSFIGKRPLTTPSEIRKALPLPKTSAEFILESRNTIKNILNGIDKRQLLIVGPCSIHHKTSAYIYAEKLKKLKEQVANTFFVVMRAYCEKARTVTGWKGFLSDPLLDGTHDIARGIQETRELYLELTNYQIPIACELLEPLAMHFLDDLISWGCIGARTSSSQVHRQMASGMNFPVGFKNATDGNLTPAVHGVANSSNPHTYIGIDENGAVATLQTSGNPNTHLVLRGSEQKTNYDTCSVGHALNLLKQFDLPQKILIDCSHDNSKKSHLNQPLVFQNVIEQIIEGNVAIRGLLLESHLIEGSQTLSLPVQIGVSVTDSCMSWEQTEKLLLSSRNQMICPKSDEVSIDKNNLISVSIS